MGYKVITPAAAPLTIEELRLEMRLDTVGGVHPDDARLLGFLAGAMQLAEQLTNSPIGQQTLEMGLDEFPDGAIKLPMPPAQSVSSLTYVDLAGATQTLAPSAYTLDEYDPQWVLPAYGTTWPATLDTANAVKVRYVAGTTTLPPAVRAALLLLVKHIAENGKEAALMRAEDIPQGICVLLNTVKNWGR